MPEIKLRQLAKTLEGRVLITNLANQVHAGILGRDKVKSFLEWAQHAKSDFSSREGALAVKSANAGPNRFDPARLYFLGNAPPFRRENLYLMRIVPLITILEKVSLVAGDDKKLQEIIAGLTTCTMPTPWADRDDEDLRQALAENSISADDFERVNLPDGFRELPLLRCRTAEENCGLSESYPGAPKFFTFWHQDESHLNRPLAFDPNALNLADHFRDILGLDHLGRFYGKNRVALGFIIIPASQCPLKEQVRPTAFDETSWARFRACYGQHDGRPGSTGWTADLAKVSKAETNVEGAPEIIVPNDPFAVDAPEFLVGYLGILEAPRDDQYDREALDGLSSADWSDRDQAFLGACMGEWDLAKVIEILVDGT